MNLDWIFAGAQTQQVMPTFPATASPGIAALTSSSALPRRFAPEQGTGPDTGSRMNKLRLPARLPAQVSAAIIYRIDADLILILDVFEKKTQKTPKRVIDICRQRAKRFDTDCE